jgi:hypothetical protein
MKLDENCRAKADETWWKIARPKLDGNCLVKQET